MLLTYTAAQNTNVIKFFSMMKKDNFDEQLCYYQVCRSAASASALAKINYRSRE